MFGSQSSSSLFRTSSSLSRTSSFLFRTESSTPVFGKPLSTPAFFTPWTRAFRFGSILSFQTQQQQQRTLSLRPAGAYALRRPFSTHQEPTLFRCSSQMAPVAPLPFVLPGGDIQSTKETISNVNDVSLEITKQLLTTEGKGKNMVFSPLSIQVVLWLLTAGSKGPTREQLLAFLRSKSTDQLNSLASHLVPLIFTDGSTKGGPCLSFANGLWVKDTIPIIPSFKEVVDTAYKAAIKHVSFVNPEEVRREVNLWAEKATKGLITEALSPGLIDHTTTLILSNALYFKGLWSRKFDASRTITDNFHLLNGTSVMAPFMRSSGEHFVRAFDGFKVLKLPYSQGEDKERQFSMYLLLPDEKYGLPALVERVCSEPGFLDRHHPRRRVPVGEFKIPRFKITSGFTASEILMDLGLVLPFNGDRDLTEMLESGVVGKAKMIHKSFIEVDEDGTKAAAASVYYTLMCSAGPVERIEEIDFVADHPFLLLIREETTGTVMFIGHVLNPLEE
ncbi:hypothetical protein FF1_030839 [Malus domestica]